MTREEDARERLMEALDAWYENRGDVDGWEGRDADLIDAYAALKRAWNGEPEDD